MAIAMQKRVAEAGADWRDAGVERPMSCRIGIHTGYCTVGYFGSEDRMDDTIIGGSVNLASRLEHQAHFGGTLISCETYAHVKGEVKCEPTGELRDKGLAYPITTYRVVDLYDDLDGNDQPIKVQRPCLTMDLDPDRSTEEERREARELLQPALSLLTHDTKPSDPGGKLGVILAKVSTPDGATLEELEASTGWRPKTVRGALSRLRRRGHRIQLVTENRRKAYRASATGAPA